MGVGRGTVPWILVSASVLVVALVYGYGTSAALAAAAPPSAGDNGLSSFVALATSDFESAAVNVANGNLLVTTADGAQVDPPLGIQLNRYYNSQPSDASQWMSWQGAGNWSLSAGPDVFLRPSGNTVTADMPSGASAVFTKNADGSYSSSTTSAKLVLSNGTYTLIDPFGTTETFDVGGTELSQQNLGDTEATKVYEDADPMETYLSALTTSAGEFQTVYPHNNATYGSTAGIQELDAYNGGYTQHGSASYGYTDADIDSSPLINFSIGSGNTSYGYNGAGLLSSITEPDGTQAQVTYNGANLVTQLEVIPPGASAYGYTFAYGAPTAPTCQTTDIGQTIVTPLAGGAATTFCYTSSGVVDHKAGATAPTPITNLGATQTTAGSDVSVSWDPPADPPLPDGSPGPAVTSYTYQFQVGGGAWSAQTTTAQAGFTIPGGSVPSGSQITVRVFATDSAGNSGTPATLAANVDVGTSTLTTTPPAGAAQTDSSVTPDSAIGGGSGSAQPNAYDIFATFDCKCYNGQKTITYRYGYYDSTKDQGFGRAKVLEKHNMWARVVEYIVGSPGQTNQGGTSGQATAYAWNSASDTTIKLIASYDTRELRDHRSFGVITAYCVGYTKCPSWVNTAKTT
jgi:YD repeat-containing protein